MACRTCARPVARSRAVQRIGRAGLVRADLPRPGAGGSAVAQASGDQRSRFRRRARPRAITPSLSMLAVPLGARTGRRHVPHLHHPLAGDAGRQGVMQLVFEKDHRTDRGQRAGPQGAGRALRRQRLGDPNGVQISASSTPSRCRAGRAGDDRFHRPLHRSRAGLQYLLKAFTSSPDGGQASGCSWPGRETVRSARRGARRHPRPDRLLGKVSETARRACCAASTSMSRRTRRRVVRHDPHRGDGRRYPGGASDLDAFPGC